MVSSGWVLQFEVVVGLVVVSLCLHGLNLRLIFFVCELISERVL